MTKHRIECVLLTWHGTVVFADPTSAKLRHESLGNVNFLSTGIRILIETDLPEKFAHLLPFPDSDLFYSSAHLGNGTAVRASNGRGYNFIKEKRLLCASEDDGYVDWSRENAGDWERFLPVPVECLSQLSNLPNRDWVELETGHPILRGAISLSRDFNFIVGGWHLDITKVFPTFYYQRTELTGPDEMVAVVAQSDRVIAFASAEYFGKLGSTMRWLRNADGDATGNTEHLRVSEPMLSDTEQAALRCVDFCYHAPTFSHRDDRRFFVDKSVYGRPPLGFVSSEVKLRRSHNCYLFLQRWVEGTIIDPAGVRKGYGFLLASENLLGGFPTGLHREGDRLMFDQNLLDEAPTLPGHYLIFYNGNLQNYYHWMIEAILSLYLLRKLSHGTVRTLLPSTLGSVSNLQYLESLKVLGFDNVELKFVEAPIVRLESASWIWAKEFIGDLPASTLLEFQSSVTASISGIIERKRIYIEREHLRRVENGIEVRDFLESVGFITVRLEGLPFIEQMRLFAGAEFVVGPHGAGLSNLIFTPPSARVIEFMPAVEMRPFFWLISSKLGHEYGMLRCETDNGSFNGNLRVDLSRLIRLLALLERA